MTANVVNSWREPGLGEEGTATYNGILVHQGQVTGLAPDLDVFWIMDYLTVGRRLQHV